MNFALLHVADCEQRLVDCILSKDVLLKRYDFM